MTPSSTAGGTGDGTGRVLLRCAAAVASPDEDVVYDAGILVEDGRIQSVGRYPTVRWHHPLAAERSRPDLVALPGFVDAHSHGRALSTLERGVADAPLEVWLTRLTALTALDPYDEAFVAASDLLSTGVTNAQVFFHSFAGAEDYLEAARQTLRGFRDAGLIPDLVLGITDRHEFLPPLDAGVDFPNDEARSLAAPERGMAPAEYFEAFDALAGALPEGCKPILGPVAPQWVSEEVLEQMAARSAGGTRVHAHLLERESQRSPLYGPSPMEKLESAGLLTGRLSVAHGVWLEPDEIECLAAGGTAVVHNPGSNTRLEAGAAPVRELLDAGVPVALGLDSHPTHHPPDVFAEMRQARTLAASREASVSEREVLKMATAGGADAVGREGDIGTLNPGARADLVLLSPEALAGPDELVSSIVGESSRSSVREVWAGGRVVVENGRLVRVKAVAAARARLYAAVRRDAARRRARLRALEEMEPWLRELWAREAARPEPAGEKTY